MAGDGTNYGDIYGDTYGYSVGLASAHATARNPTVGPALATASATALQPQLRPNPPLPENLGASILPVTIDATVTLPAYGGLVTSLAGSYGGSAVMVDSADAAVIPVTTDASATSLSGSYGGTLTTIAYGAALVGWTMQSVNLTLAENNDESVNVAITQNGAALNLTGATVNMYLKTAAGTPDGSALVLSSAGGSPAITITSAAGGLCTVLIPRADLYPETYTFYRIDVVFSGLQNTAVYGNINWITL